MLLTAATPKQIVHAYPADASLEFGTSFWHAGPVEDGTLLHRVRLSTAPPDMQVKRRVVFDVQFAEPGESGGSRVHELLQRIRDHIRDVVFPGLERFL